MAANQVPLDITLLLVFLSFNMIKRTKAPDSNRIRVKLDASMELVPSANRHNTEFAANAINARIVNIRVLAT